MRKVKKQQLLLRNTRIKNELFISLDDELCAHHNVIQRLYADPYFQQPQYHEVRKDLHEIFKTKTWPECLESEA